MRFLSIVTFVVVCSSTYAVSIQSRQPTDLLEAYSQYKLSGRFRNREISEITKNYLEKTQKKIDTLRETAGNMTFDEFLSSFVQLLADFLELPMENKKELVEITRKEGDTSSAFPVNFKVLKSPSDIVIYEAFKSIDWINEPEKLIEYLEEKTPKEGNELRKLYTEGKKQFDLIQSEEGKDLVRKVLQVFYNHRNEDALTEEMTIEITKLFNALTREQKLDVLKKLTFPVHPMLRMTHSLLVMAFNFKSMQDEY